MVNEKGRKTTCLLFTAKQGKTDKVSNAHMLTISLTTSHLPSQCTGLLTEATEELTAKLSWALRRFIYFPRASYSCSLHFVTLK